MRSMCSGAMPGPLSTTEISRPRVLARTDAVLVRDRDLLVEPHLLELHDDLVRARLALQRLGVAVVALGAHVEPVRARLDLARREGSRPEELAVEEDARAGNVGVDAQARCRDPGASLGFGSRGGRRFGRRRARSRPRRGRRTRGGRRARRVLGAPCHEVDHETDRGQGDGQRDRHEPRSAPVTPRPPECLHLCCSPRGSRQSDRTSAASRTAPDGSQPRLQSSKARWIR